MSDELQPLHDAIQRLCLRDEDDRPISSKGGIQRWLVDLRPLLLRRESLVALAAAFWRLYRDFGPCQIGTMETAGIPLLAALLLCAPPERADISGFVIRKQRKTTGMGQTIEGVLGDAPMVLVDDILNSSASAEKARATLAAAGREITHMFVVIDYRSRAGLAWRKQNKIDVRSLFTLVDFGLTLRSDPAPPSQVYRELWCTDVSGGFPFHLVPKSTPLLVGGTIYRGCDAGKMHAFDAETGSILWEHHATGSAPRKGVWSSPALHDGRLYYGAYNGVVYALDAHTGREFWSQSLCEWVGASPLVVPEHRLLYIGLEYARPWAHGSLIALDLKTGAKVWELLVTNLQHGSAAYWGGGDLVIWGSADHQTVAVKAKTGKAVWSFATRRSVKYAPAVDEERGLVAFASFDKSIYLLDAGTGEKRGEWQTGEICYTTPLFARGRLFCGSGDRHLYVIDIETGELISKIDFGARIYASPRLIDGHVVFGTCGGKLVELDVVTLEIKGLLQLPDAITNAVAASPDGRRLFVSTYMNQLYGIERCVETSAPG